MSRSVLFRAHRYGRSRTLMNLKITSTCIGVFESTAEICAYFGGIRPNRVSCAITRKKPLAFKSERFWVEVFEEPTKNSVRKMLRQKFGLRRHWMRPDGIYVREDKGQEWRFFENDFEEAVERMTG